MSSLRIVSLSITTLLVAGCCLPAYGENLQHLRQLLSSRQCRSCDLVGSGLAYANLVSADLRGADLRGANLSQADLRGADLTGANLMGANLNGAILQGTVFAEANLSQADLRGAYVANADFQGATVSNVQLRGAIGVPLSLLNAQELHNWGVDEVSRGNYGAAIDYYSQAISLEPNRAITTINRSLAYLRLNNLTAAMTDAQRAAALFKEQGNTPAYEATQKLIRDIERVATQRPEAPSTGIGLEIINGLGSLLPLLLF